MDGKEALRKLRQRKTAVIEPDELPELLVSAEIIREDDTHMAGAIRILRVGRRIMVQEQTAKSREIIIRELGSLTEADTFVDERLATYERMWDGCGCKIDYFN